MLKNATDDLEKILDGFIKKDVIINQNGFIESTYSIDKLKYIIEYDILNILDDNSKNYLKINLNQVYKIENEKNRLMFYLDNDTIITLSLKR